MKQTCNVSVQDENTMGACDTMTVDQGREPPFLLAALLAHGRPALVLEGERDALGRWKAGGGGAEDWITLEVAAACST